ncbi:hypothetical protein JYU04_03990, partial [Dehalococcoides mccartyi]|nr:hypothetical protein [Dehalococcoides mccartyi]
KQFSEVPWILGGDKKNYETRHKSSSFGSSNPLRGEETTLNSHFIDVAKTMNERTPKSFQLNLLDNTEVLSWASTIDRKRGKSKSSARKFVNLSDDGLDLLDELKTWLKFWSSFRDTSARTRVASLQQEVAPQLSKMVNSIAYSAFNFYCPRCNSDVINDLQSRDYSVSDGADHQPITFSKNTRCALDPSSELWKCRACESETSEPIPIHKAVDEVLHPAFDYLMNEHKLERSKAHRDVQAKESEAEYDLRSEIDRIQMEQLGNIDRLSDDHSNLAAEIRGEKLAIDSLAEILDVQDREANKAIASIQANSAEYEERISRRTEAVLNHIDEIKQSEMVALEKELNQLSRAKKVDDMRRDQIQLSILQTSGEIRDSVKENTQVTAQGFKEVTGAVQEGTRVSAQGFKEMTGAVREGTKATQQGNAITSAMSRHALGFDPSQVSPLSQPGKALSQAAAEIGGAFKGSSPAEIEKNRL